MRTLQLLTLVCLFALAKGVNAQAVLTFGGNAQHTAIYQPAAQDLNRIRWSTSIDLNNTENLSARSHVVTANFTGNNGWANSSGSDSGAPQVVNKDGTTTVLASSSDPSTVGRPVTFTATVSVTAPGSGIPSGPVTFRDKNTTLGTGALDSTGRATFTTSTLSQGPIRSLPPMAEVRSIRQARHRHWCRMSARNSALEYFLGASDRHFRLTIVGSDRYARK